MCESTGTCISCQGQGVKVVEWDFESPAEGGPAYPTQSETVKCTACDGSGNEDGWSWQPR